MTRAIQHAVATSSSFFSSAAAAASSSSSTPKTQRTVLIPDKSIKSAAAAYKGIRMQALQKVLFERGSHKPTTTATTAVSSRSFLRSDENSDDDDDEGLRQSIEEAEPNITSTENDDAGREMQMREHFPHTHIHSPHLPFSRKDLRERVNQETYRTQIQKHCASGGTRKGEPQCYIEHLFVNNGIYYGQSNDDDDENDVDSNLNNTARHGSLHEHHHKATNDQKSAPVPSGVTLALLNTLRTVLKLNA